MGLASMADSCPAVITTKTTNKPRTRARASRFCNGPGDKLERTSPGSSGTIAAVFSIGMRFYARWRLASPTGYRLPSRPGRRRAWIARGVADGRQKLLRVERLLEQAEVAAIGGRRSIHHVEMACDENDRKA